MTRRYKLVECDDGTLSEAEITEAANTLSGFCYYRDIGLALSAALAGAGKDGWQPIESAPKDGTVVDLWHKAGARMVEVWWADDCWSNCLDDCDFTHWMPIPADPPISAAKEKP